MRHPASTHAYRFGTAPTRGKLAMGRDVDALDALPDQKILQADREYLAKHDINTIFSQVLENICKSKPADPLQFMIDFLQHREEEAQDPATGFPSHRQKLVQKLFEKGAGGKLSFTLGAGNLAVTSYVRKYGGQAMDDPELGRHFAAYKASGQFEMTEGELTAYLAAAARNIPNAKFDEMMAEMSS